MVMAVMGLVLFTGEPRCGSGERGGGLVRFGSSDNLNRFAVSFHGCFDLLENLSGQLCVKDALAAIVWIREANGLNPDRLMSGADP